jgi:hypothetical protein
LLGNRFVVGNVGFPLRTADGQKRPVQFSGYRTHGTPSYSLDWGGQVVQWTVAAAPAAVGLQYTFALPEAREAVQFVINKKGIEVTSSAGEWRNGILTVPAAAAKNFTVTLTLPIGGPK